MKVQCRQCRAVFNLPVTVEQIARWRNGALAQNAFPNLSADDRELIISQTCGKCFDAMFAEKADA